MFDRSAFKGGDGRLSTDLGSFVNKGNSGRIKTLLENTIADSIRLPTRVQDRPKLKYVSVYKRHCSPSIGCWHCI